MLSARLLAGVQEALWELLGRLVAECLAERVRGLLVEAGALRPACPRGHGDLAAKRRQRSDDERVRILAVPRRDRGDLRRRHLAAVLKDHRAVLEVVDRLDLDHRLVVLPEDEWLEVVPAACGRNGVPLRRRTRSERRVVRAARQLRVRLELAAGGPDRDDRGLRAAARRAPAEGAKSDHGGESDDAGRGERVEDRPLPLAEVARRRLAGALFRRLDAAGRRRRGAGLLLRRHEPFIQAETATCSPKNAATAA